MLILGFWPVNARLLIANDTAFYAIKVFQSYKDETVVIKALCNSPPIIRLKRFPSPAGIEPGTARSARGSSSEEYLHLEFL